MNPSSRLFTAVGVAMLAVVALLAVASWSAPAAEAGEKIWILKFEHEHPKRIQMDDDTKQFKVYWYMPYTITNEDDEDHKFLLDITATSDKGFKYDDGFYPRVADRIRKRLRLEEGDLRTAREVSLALDWTDKAAAVDPDKSSPQYDNLEPPAFRPKVVPELWEPKAGGPFPPWKWTEDPESDQAKLRYPRVINLPVIKAKETWNCVAIFDRWDGEMDLLKIQVQGLTNDIIMKSEKPHERTLTERVLEIHYERPGDEFWSTYDTLTFIQRKWVDVTRTIKTDLR